MEARDLKEKIDSDLNQMDANAFASEWGLRSPTGRIAEGSN